MVQSIFHVFRTPLPWMLLGKPTGSIGLILAMLLLQGAPGVWAADNPALKPHLPPVANINENMEAIDSTDLKSVDPLEPVTLAAIANPTVQLHNPVDRMDNAIHVQESDDELDALRTLQVSVNEEDLRLLWEATVEQNPVIRFSLEKLAIPQDLHANHSSRFLNKTLSALITGAVLGSTLLPGGSYYQNMATMAGGDVVRNALTGRNKPVMSALSATEQIQLAGLVDELKGRLIQTYTDYKNTLQSLADARELSIKNNTLYSKTLQGDDELAKVAAASAYYKAHLQETRLLQKAKLYRMQLERIAGKDAVKSMMLAVPITQADIANAKPIRLKGLSKLERLKNEAMSPSDQPNPGNNQTSRATPPSQPIAVPKAPSVAAPSVPTAPPLMNTTPNPPASPASPGTTGLAPKRGLTDMDDESLLYDYH